MSARRIAYVLIVLAGFLLVAASFLTASDGPNHLEPVPAYSHSGDGYEELVFSTLIKDRFPKVWMIVRPSFRPEYAVILRRVEPESKSDSAYYELEYAVAEQPVWNWRDVGDGTQVLDLRKDVDVDRRLARLPADVSESLIATWKEVLRQTRYADKDWLGLDGVTYEFYAPPDLFGQTWSPESGTPKMMVDCGELLIQYVDIGPVLREEVIERLSGLIERLRAECD